MPKASGPRIQTLAPAAGSASEAVQAPRPAPVTIAPPKPVTVSNTSDTPTESFGLLTEKNGGLPANMWKDASRGNLEILLPMLGGGFVHEPVRELATRLLLTRADMPLPKQSNKNLLAMRLKALFLMGKEDKAQEMIEALPASLRSENMERLLAELHLLKSDTAKACEMAHAAVQEYDELYWQKLMIYCQASTGKADEANLGLSILDEQSRQPEGHFVQLINLLTNPKSKNKDALKSLPENISTLDAAMLIASGHGAALPGDYLDRAPLPVFRALANHSKTPLLTRTVAWEQLVKFGTDASELAKMYSAFDFPAKQLKGDLPEEDLLKGAKGSALLYQLQQNAKTPDQRMKIIAKALNLFKDAGLKPVGWKLYLPAVKELSESAPGSLEAARFAWQAITILTMNGQPEETHSWLRTLSAFEKKNPAFALQRATGEMLLQFAERESASQNVQAVFIPGNASQAEIKRLLRLYNLLEMFGYTIDEDARQQQVSQRLNYSVEMPSPALLTMLDEAYKYGHTGEMLLTAMLAMGGGDLSRTSDEVLLKSLKSLSAAGFNKEARRIAVQSVLAID